MRVHIGNYIEWIGPYQIAEKIFFWVKKYDDKFNHTKEYDRVHEFGRWLSEDKNGEASWITNMCQWIYDRRKRKVKIKIDAYDIWNMDGTLSIIILPMLKMLRDDKHGSPGDMIGFNQTSNSPQYCFDFYEEGDSFAWEEGHKQWSEIVDKMIWSFEQNHPDYDWEDQYHTDAGYDVDGARLHAEKIQEGIDLFGKYYRNLWT